MNDEIRTRFVNAIAKQLDAERVIEVHLFPGIRQGGVESGVAVIAVERERDLTLDVDGGESRTAEAFEVAVLETAEEVTVDDQLDDETSFMSDDVMEESPYRDAVPEPPEAEDVVVPRASRYIVFSARYRHTLKGLDRGKWEVSVTEEADAPLVTVDAVVRGVQRRSGDADETMRLSGEEFRAALIAP